MSSLKLPIIFNIAEIKIDTAAAKRCIRTVVTCLSFVLTIASYSIDK